MTPNELHAKTRARVAAEYGRVCRRKAQLERMLDSMDDTAGLADAFDTELAPKQGAPKP